MNKLILPFHHITNQDRSQVGSKAVNIAAMMGLGLAVPDGFCISAQAYIDFIQESGIDRKLVMELGRKRFADMRWEELWDASLRIRNLFIKATLPSIIERAILDQIQSQLPSQPLAIRSSSLDEDNPKSSFAGIHESFINIEQPASIIKCIKLVWASLWSDAALLYQQELALDIQRSAMAVIVQSLIIGDRSGVAFSMDPNNKNQMVLESVYGLNKGLVDGDVEPDRYYLNRESGELVSSLASQHEHQAVIRSEGVAIVAKTSGSKLTLDSKELQAIYQMVMKLERAFDGPQDVEWTLQQERLYGLQSRPITTVNEDSKSWYLSLRRTQENLQLLAKRIEGEILPQMDAIAQAQAHVDLSRLSDEALAEIISQRDCVYKKWHDVYWEECIPFAHGVRLFGLIYTDKIQPEDPFEFIELIQPDQMLGLNRNQTIEKVINQIKANPNRITTDYQVEDSFLDQAIDRLINQLGEVIGDETISVKNKKAMVKFLYTMAQKKQWRQQAPRSDVLKKTNQFMAAFPDAEQEQAKQLLDLAKKSYQLRDDDNIYLGKLQAQLTAALLESQMRLGKRCDHAMTCTNPEEVMTALKDKKYQPKFGLQTKVSQSSRSIQARQLRGQPAAPGLARGLARVITTTADLLNVQPGEILVCDAIDPTMTFVVPSVAGIIERRGGMLIHGAIIAREYGLPCVTGIPEATTYIQTGNEVSLDGTIGLVINHSKGL